MVGISRRFLSDVYQIFRCRAINRDPETYGPDAETFNPNRYLNSKNQLKSGNENHCTYGFGRRKCVGSTFANNSTFP